MSLLFSGHMASTVLSTIAKWYWQLSTTIRNFSQPSSKNCNYPKISASIKNMSAMYIRQSFPRLISERAGLRKLYKLNFDGYQQLIFVS